MGKLVLDSHGLEVPAAREAALCPRCTRQGDLLAGLAAAGLVHTVAWVVPTLGSWPLPETGSFGYLPVLYAVGALVGLGHSVFLPERNPWPLTTASASFAAGFGCFWVGLMTAPIPDACLYEPGYPWISYPFQLLGLSLLLMAGSFLGEWLVRRLAPGGEVPWASRAALRLAAPAVLWGVPLTVLGYFETGGQLQFEPVLVGILAGILAGSAMLLRPLTGSHLPATTPLLLPEEEPLR